MKKIITARDKHMKKYLQQPQNAKDFLKKHLSPEILRKTDLNNLTVEHMSFITPGLEDFSSDIVFKTKINDEIGYICCLSKNQGELSIFDLIPIFYYISQILITCIDNNQQTVAQPTIPIVYPLILYKWNKPLNYDLFSPAQEWLSQKTFYQPLYSMYATSSKNKDIANYCTYTPFLFVLIESLPQSDNDDNAYDLVSCFNSFAARYGEKVTFGAIKSYIRARVDNKQQFIEFVERGIKVTLAAKFKQKTSQPDKEEIQLECKCTQNELQKSLQQGIQKGIEKGANQKTRDIVLAMLKEKTDLTFIAKITNLSINQIREIEAQNKTQNIFKTNEYS